MARPKKSRPLAFKSKAKIPNMTMRFVDRDAVMSIKISGTAAVEMDATLE